MSDICEKLSENTTQCGETLKKQPLTVVGGIALAYVAIHVIIAIIKAVWKHRWFAVAGGALLGAGYAMNTRREAAEQPNITEPVDCTNPKPVDTVEPIQ
jgi:hypothetical protein